MSSISKSSANCARCKPSLANTITLSPKELAKVTMDKHFETVGHDIFLFKECGYVGLCPEIDYTYVKNFQEKLNK